VSALCALMTLLLVAVATPRVAAQTTNPGRVEVAGGIRVAGTTSFPEVPVVEATPGGGQRTVFVTRSRIEPSISGDARIAVSLFRGLAVEAGVAVGDATLATTIDDDMEVGSSVTVRESLRQYLVEGGLRFSPPRWRRSRWQPFVVAGGGYLRQLHEGRTLLETGRTLYAGGGARLFLTSPRSSGVSSGLRFDLRGTLVRGGISVDDSSRGLPVVHAAYFLRF
jgi:hypothetical protein